VVAVPGGARVNFWGEDRAPRGVLRLGRGPAALQAALQGLAACPPIVDLDADQDRWAGASAENLDPRALGLTACNLAYIIYTSPPASQKA
jgi:hypothetical protein